MKSRYSLLNQPKQRFSHDVVVDGDSVLKERGGERGNRSNLANRGNNNDEKNLSLRNSGIHLASLSSSPSSPVTPAPRLTPATPIFYFSDRSDVSEHSHHFSRESSGQYRPGPKYQKGDNVLYKSTVQGFEALEEASILGVHFDDMLEPYYTLRMVRDGREKQTDETRLFPLSSRSLPSPPNGNVALGVASVIAMTGLGASQQRDRKEQHPREEGRSMNDSSHRPRFEMLNNQRQRRRAFLDSPLNARNERNNQPSEEVEHHHPHPHGNYGNRPWNANSTNAMNATAEPPQDIHGRVEVRARTDGHSSIYLHDRRDNHRSNILRLSSFGPLTPPTPSPKVDGSTPTVQQEAGGGEGGEGGGGFMQRVMRHSWTSLYSNYSKWRDGSEDRENENGTRDSIDERSRDTARLRKRDLSHPTQNEGKGRSERNKKTKLSAAEDTTSSEVTGRSSCSHSSNHCSNSSSNSRGDKRKCSQWNEANEANEAGGEGNQNKIARRGDSEGGDSKNGNEVGRVDVGRDDAETLGSHVNDIHESEMCHRRDETSIGSAAVCSGVICAEMSNDVEAGLEDRECAHPSKRPLRKISPQNTLHDSRDDSDVAPQKRQRSNSYDGDAERNGLEETNATATLTDGTDGDNNNNNESSIIIRSIKSSKDSKRIESSMGASHYRRPPINLKFYNFKMEPMRPVEDASSSKNSTDAKHDDDSNDSSSNAKNSSSSGNPINSSNPSNPANDAYDKPSKKPRKKRFYTPYRADYSIFRSNRSNCPTSKESKANKKPHRFIISSKANNGSTMDDKKKLDALSIATEILRERQEKKAPRRDDCSNDGLFGDASIVLDDERFRSNKERKSEDGERSSQLMCDETSSHPNHEEREIHDTCDVPREDPSLDHPDASATCIDERDGKSRDDDASTATSEDTDVGTSQERCLQENAEDSSSKVTSAENAEDSNGEAPSASSCSSTATEREPADASTTPSSGSMASDLPFDFIPRPPLLDRQRRKDVASQDHHSSNHSSKANAYGASGHSSHLSTEHVSRYGNSSWASETSHAGDTSKAAKAAKVAKMHKPILKKPFDLRLARLCDPDNFANLKYAKYSNYASSPNQYPNIYPRYSQRPIGLAAPLPTIAPVEPPTASSTQSVSTSSSSPLDPLPFNFMDGTTAASATNTSAGPQCSRSSATHPQDDKSGDDGSSSHNAYDSFDPISLVVGFVATAASNVVQKLSNGGLEHSKEKTPSDSIKSASGSANPHDVTGGTSCGAYNVSNPFRNSHDSRAARAKRRSLRKSPSESSVPTTRPSKSMRKHAFYPNQRSWPTHSTKSVRPTNVQTAASTNTADTANKANTTLPFDFKPKPAPSASTTATIARATGATSNHTGTPPPSTPPPPPPRVRWATNLVQSKIITPFKVVEEQQQEWICKDCGLNNPKEDTFCFFCVVHQEEEDGYLDDVDNLDGFDSVSGGDGVEGVKGVEGVEGVSNGSPTTESVSDPETSAPSSAEFRDDDWTCKECGLNNPKEDTSCLFCDIHNDGDDADTDIDELEKLS